MSKDLFLLGPKRHRLMMHELFKITTSKMNQLYTSASECEWVRSVPSSKNPISYHHDFIEIHESLDCQVCENESFKAFDLKALEEFPLVQETHIGQENRVEFNISSGFSARAPPNS